MSLLIQAAVVGDVGRVQERYAIYALPLLICLFALYAARGWPHLRLHALVAAVAATAAAVVPLAGYAAGGGTGQSFVLVSLQELERYVGDVGLASLVFAAAATIASAIVLAVASLRPRLGTVAALAVTAAVGVGMTGDGQRPLRGEPLSREGDLPSRRPVLGRCCRERPGDSSRAPRSVRGDLHTTLFWNRSVQRLVLLDDAASPDPFAAPSADLDDAGHLVGTTGLVLADTYGSAVVLRNAVRLASGPTKTLWRSRSTPQLQLTMTGRYFSGALSSEGELRVWPEHAGGKLAGWLELDLSAPSGAAPLPFRVELPAGHSSEHRIRGGRTTTIRVPVCAAGAWKAPFPAGTDALAHGTLVGLDSSEPRFVGDAAACA